MARARFIAEDDPCVIFDRTFPPGEWVDTEGMADHEVARLAANRTFEVEGFKRPKNMVPAKV